METNELPEDVKAKIEEYTMNVYPEYRSVMGIAAEFGYRLALQSKEEQLKAKDEALALCHDLLVQAKPLLVKAGVLDTFRIDDAVKEIDSLLSQSTDKQP